MDVISLEKEYRLKREESQAQSSRNCQLNAKQTEKSEPLKSEVKYVQEENQRPWEERFLRSKDEQ